MVELFLQVLELVFLLVYDFGILPNLLFKVEDQVVFADGAVVL